MPRITNHTVGQLMSGAAAIVVLAAAMPVMAQERSFDVEAGPASRTIPEFARQAGMQIIAKADAVKGKRTNRLRGSYNVEEALALLLRETGLEAGAAQNGIVTVRATSARSGVTASGGGGQGGEDVAIAEILVEGVRTLNADIRRTEDDPQPYVVLGKEEIERSGATNVQDFLRKRLPMNNTSFRSSDSVATVDGNRSNVNLRGLPGQTLILVNGRRVTGAAGVGQVAGSTMQFDLNGIPLSAIERIEVLPATASGIYGGGATGGVVNVILKRGYRGVDVSLSYGDAFAGGAERKRVDLSGGFSFEGGRTNVSFSGSYEHANPLLRGERPFISRYLAELYAAAPAGYMPPQTPPIGTTTNIRSTNGANLVLDNGTMLNSPITSVPVGYAGPASDGGAGLAARAGQYNLNPANTAQANGLRASLQSGSELVSVIGSIERRFGDEVKAFIDVGYNINRSTAPINQAGNANLVTLAANAAGNPFQQQIQITVPNSAADSAVRTQFSDLRVTGGIIFDLPARWRGEFDVGWERSRTHTKSGLQANGAGAAISSGALNPFRDTSQAPLEIEQYLAPSIIYTPSDTTLETSALRLGGPVGRLPGGEAQVTILLEGRGARRSEDSSYFAPPLNFTTFFPERSQRVRSAYGEVRLPFIGASNGVALVEELELQLSIRHDQYTSRGITDQVGWVGTPDMPPTPFPATVGATNKVRSTDFTAAIKWKPVEDLTLRASYGTGFQPPSVDQLVAGIVSNGLVSSGVRDPLRGNAFVTSGDVRQGGNPDLVPELSKSWSVGGVFAPTFFPGFRFSIDYVNIRKTDNITSFPGGIQALVQANASDGLFADRITRASANLPGDQPGWAPPLLLVDNTSINLARARVEAFDVQLDYKMDTSIGTFSLFAIGTYQPVYKTQVFTTSPIIDNVGFSGGPVKYKGNLGLDWIKDQWAAGWSTSYVDSYSYTFPGAPDTSIAVFRNFSHGPDLEIPSQVYHDAYLSYRLGEGIGPVSGAKVQLSISNVFNKKPPRFGNSYSTFGDPRLARYMLSLNTHF